VAGGPAFLMEPFDQKKFTHGQKWWVDSYTSSIYGDADRCAHFIVKENAGKFTIASQWIDGDNQVNQAELVVKEDSSHPARFFLEAEGDLVFEIGVVATDYDNWGIVWAKTGDKSAYHVTTTKPQNQAPFQAQIDEALKKLSINGAEMRKVKNEDCKDTL